MSDGKKKLSFLTVISTIICVVFVCEAAAPAAAIGNQQFFWWIFLILTFLLPYGMVVAELGTTYDGEGGIYDWVRDGLGDKWGARISYYYWVNYPLWIASLATMFPDIFGHGLWRRVQLDRQDGYRSCLCVDRLPHGPLQGGRLRVGP